MPQDIEISLYWKKLTSHWWYQTPNSKFMFIIVFFGWLTSVSTKGAPIESTMVSKTRARIIFFYNYIFI
ncbi:hypothetical protein PRUPE_4G231500 [Prunus persica]|uniref:Uncharacterized protein n=1 Tax=Prunus persica TaxID=3760 RepID=A0A251PPU8_PRUPE|nr:hypothetical protein PRUPE_4G231500 [Prunus persica]